MFKSLIIKGLKNRKKTTLLLLLVISLSTFLLSFIFIYDHHQKIKQEELTYQRYGNFHGIDYSGNNSKYDCKDIEMVGNCYLVGELNVPQEYLGSFDTNMFSLANFNLLEGRLPLDNKEVVVETALLDTLKISYEVNKNISIVVNGTAITYKIVGIIPSYTNSWVTDQEHFYPGMITTNETSNSKISFIKMKDNRSDTIYNLNVLINTNSYPNLLPVEQSSGMTGEEIELREYDESLEEKQLLFFVAIIILTDIIIILSVFSNSIKQRRKQISLLRALGCKKVEVSRLLFFEGVVVASVGVLLGSILVIMVCLAMSMKILLAVIVGCALLNIIIVIISSMIPTLYISKIELTGNFSKKRRKYINNSAIFPLITICISTVFIYYVYQSVGAYNAYSINQAYRKVSSDYSITQEYFDINTAISNLDGYRISDVEKIRNIAGIDEVYYEQGYNFIVDTIIDNTNMVGLSIVGLEDNQKEDIKDIFEDKQVYQDFISGKQLCYFVKEGYEIGNLGQVLKKNNNSIELDITINNKTIKQKITLIHLESTDNFIVGNSFLNLVGVSDVITNSYHLNNTLCSYINARTSKDANYDVTDRQMSQLGFSNQRISNEQYSLEEKQRVISVTVITTVVTVLSLGILYNYWIGYMYTKKRDIGILKAVGFEDKRVIKRYGNKAIIIVLITFVLSLTITFLITFIPNYLSSAKEASLLGGKVNALHLLLNTLDTMLDIKFIFIMSIYIIALLIICLYPIKQILKNDIIENIQFLE